MSAVPERPRYGVLDTRIWVDLESVDPASLPVEPDLTAVTMAELHQGVAMTSDPALRATRTERLATAIISFAPLPVDGDAAARYGSLVALTIAAGRGPRPWRMDLMIAAIASSRGLALHTRNGADFAGLDAMMTVVEL